MEEIMHTGRIISVNAVSTDVEILQTSACAGCRAKSLCGMSEQKKKVVTVPTDTSVLRKEGDEVTLCMKRSMGMKAVWVAYVIPLAVMMMAIAALSTAGAGELATGLGAISAVAVYYLLILCFRNRMRNEFVFYIK